MFSCESCKIFKKNIFHRTTPVADDKGVDYAVSKPMKHASWLICSNISFFFSSITILAFKNPKKSPYILQNNFVSFAVKVA